MLAGVTANPQTQMDWPVEIVRKYRILDRAGAGAYGAVFKAKTIKTIAAPHPNPEFVAIKRTLDRAEKDPNDNGHVPHDVLREVGHLKALNHENVIKLLEAIFVRHNNRNRGYLVLEYCPDNLLQRIRNSDGGLGLPLSACYLHQILSGLKYCHDSKIFHRDLKPENILLSENDTIKIADFGLSRGISCPAKVLSPNTTTLTYRAPELLQPKNEEILYSTYSHEIDMWSVGCVFGEMIRGYALFRSTNEIGIMKDMIAKLGPPAEDDFPTAIEWPRFYAAQKPGGIGLAKSLGFMEPLSSSCVLAVALLQGLLTYSRIERLRASQALKHAFFASDAANMRMVTGP
ncbi:Cell division protein kinase 1 [Geranomyces variabilis]|uniref:Cell division protein kinase 1 n=1 Tax=Geranomyces variabilis TaxID=109894 RepID=A0AAD5TMV2_9FUNG|nr:Cell division protein kinase 1 [Geranomyces variabilis]